LSNSETGDGGDEDHSAQPASLPLYYLGIRPEAQELANSETGR